MNVNIPDQIIYLQLCKFIKRIRKWWKRSVLYSYFQLLIWPIIIFGCLAIIIFYLTYTHYDYDRCLWENILVEGHGVLGDILIFAIMIKLFDEFTRKKNENRRCLNEIDDFRDREGGQVGYKNIANLKRLMANRYKKKINLERVYLGGMWLKRDPVFVYHISKYLMNANLKRAELDHMSLQGAILRGADLESADLHNAHLENAKLWNANLEGADLMLAKLNGANLVRAKLTGANLWGADFTDAVVESDQLCKAWTLHKAILDQEIKEQVKEKCPKLLDLPTTVFKRVKENDTVPELSPGRKPPILNPLK